MQEKQRPYATSLRIPPDLLKTVKKNANLSRRSVSNEIIFILQKYYNSQLK